MKKTLREALQNRRSYYALSPESPVKEDEIVDILHFALRYVPSAFDSRTTRLVLLRGDSHAALWQIVKDTLRGIVAPEKFAATETKIDRSFASGCGTVLFFEDRDVVDSLRRRFPTYAENFDRWSDHTSAMHQLAVWTMLEDAGLGASLQHYNPLIDSAVTARWSLPASWRLVAQMPFGTALDIPAPRDTSSTADNLRIFG